MRSLLVLTAAFVAACNPYEPDLGDVPFTCDLDERSCPEGYVAVDVSATRCECHREGADDPDDQPSGIDGGQSATCSGDPDNDAVDSATATAVGRGALTYFTSTSICDAADVDFYEVTLPADHLVLEATLDMDTNLGVLDVRIVNVGGAPLAMGERNGNKAVARYTATSPGIYLVEVASMSGFTTYRLDIAAR